VSADLVVVDFGAGNVASMVKALRKLGASPAIVTSPGEVEGASRVIVPGVGAFGAAMTELRKRHLEHAIRAAVERGVPVLGVCIGLQVFFESSEETPGVVGLGLFEGGCKRFGEARLKVPQIGWNSVKPEASSKLFQGIPEGSSFYFIHSYYACPKDPTIVAATADYGVDYPCAVERGKLAAVQFHPEKSGRNGLKILENFLAP
jgi:imidazole glycerol phosphate synthase glutamine amidotransferase subunit